MTRVLVTGATRGPGRTLARALAERGVALYLAARDEAALEALADELREACEADVETQAVDLSQSINASVLAMEWDGADVAVLLAGGSGLDSDDEWTRRRAWEARVFGAQALVREFKETMAERGAGAVILPPPDGTSPDAAMARAALEALVQAEDADAVRVLSIPPEDVPSFVKPEEEKT